MDQIVFDIETKNSFDDVGGQENLKQLEMSVIGIYSYGRDDYFCFEAEETEKIRALFKNSRLLIGFAVKRFDLPILEKYLPSADGFNISVISCFDILDEIEKTFGRRIGLNLLAQANLGLKKTAAGLEAIEFYRRGEIQKLKDYCLNDVKLTKKLYDLLLVQGFLWLPQKNSPQMLKWEMNC